MSADDDAPEEEAEEGAPAWLATFADLMSLLMCFFVLLLSFSEMDVQKYKQVAGSMKDAFGIQRTIKADEIPKGTSIIAQEFSPGKPEISALEIIQQETTEDSQTYLEQYSKLVPTDVQELLRKAEEALGEEIDTDQVEVVPYNRGVLIRIREQNSFPSGSAVLQSRFKEILDNVVELLNDVEGFVVVAGHTDDIPISSTRYPSNWVLSAARAASVVHYMKTRSKKFYNRIEIRAHADTQPVVDNDTAEHRAQNRRIEINIAVVSEESY